MKFFFFEGHDGGKYRLSNSLPLSPGINVLTKKNRSRESIEIAKKNILSNSILDDCKRKPWIETKGSKWMYVGRADPAKGQMKGLLAFLHYLQYEPEAVLWFFIQFAPDDPEGFS